MTTQSRLELTIFSRIEKAIAFSLLCSKMMYANASVEITMGEKHNDLTEIIAQTLSEMKMEQGEKFDPDKVNLAELERRTGISRAKLRRIKSRVDRHLTMPAPHRSVRAAFPHMALHNNIYSFRIS